MRLARDPDRAMTFHMICTQFEVVTATSPSDRSEFKRVDADITQETAMSIQFFSFRSSTNNRLYMPSTYRRSVSWLPQIGDVFPDFFAETTEGDLRFFDWAEGHWTYLFSHPAAMTPVCTTELVALSSALPDFDAKGVKLLGFSGSTLETQRAWHADIERIFDVPVTYPFVADPDLKMAKSFGMLHTNASSDWPIRKSFILDPQMRIRMIFEYPIYIGRGTDEIIRMIDALQKLDSTGLGIPADWLPGDDLIFAENMADPEAKARYGDRFVRLTGYLAVIRDTLAKKASCNEDDNAKRPHID